MYPLVNQISTLEQSKILKDEYGLELDTYFVWHKSYVPHSIEDEGGKMVISTKEDAVFDLGKGLIDIYYPAPSCAELGVLLPATIITDKFDGEQEWWLNIDTEEGRRFYTGYDEEIVDSKHETHAKADLLIHLLKEKIVNPKDLTLED